MNKSRDEIARAAADACCNWLSPETDPITRDERDKCAAIITRAIDQYADACAAEKVSDTKLLEAGREALLALATFKLTDSQNEYREIGDMLRSQMLMAHDLLFAALSAQSQAKEGGQ